MHCATDLGACTARSRPKRVQRNVMMRVACAMPARKTQAPFQHLVVPVAQTGTRAKGAPGDPELAGRSPSPPTPPLRDVSVRKSFRTRPARTLTTSDRVLSAMALFTVENREWTVEAAATRLALPLTTMYRYFRSLADSGLIMTLATGRYVLGPAIMQYDRQMRYSDPLTLVARPIMQE